MRGVGRSTLIFVLLSSAVHLAAQAKKSLRYTVSPGTTVAIANDYGSVRVRSVPGREVIVSATPRSPSVEIVGSQAGNRVEVASHYAPAQAAAQPSVDYDVQLPADVTLSVRTASASVQVAGINGGVTVESSTGPVEIRQGRGGPVRVHTLDGAVTLDDIENSAVNVESVNGPVTLTSVRGPRVSASTNGSPIHFAGDCAGTGQYILATRSGNIAVSLPASASVRVTARSLHGAVQDSFPLQPDAHPRVAVIAGKSLAGHANSGQASLTLRSFSGTIVLQKQ